MILACSARKTLKINRNLQNIEEFQPQNAIKAQTKSQHTNSRLSIGYHSRFVVDFHSVCDLISSEAIYGQFRGDTHEYF
jgi:hypothetical protein